MTGVFRTSPVSIKAFGWLMAAASLGAIGQLFFYYPVHTLWQFLQAPETALSLVLGVMQALGYNLLFWYLIVRRANRIAAWIYTALTILWIGLMAYQWRAYLPAEGTSDIGPALVLSVMAMHAVAAAVLYFPAAREWLRMRGQIPDHREIFG